MIRTKEAFSSFAVNNLDKAREFYGKTLGMDVATGEMGMLNLKVAKGDKVIIYPKPDHEPAVFTILNLPVDNIDEAVDYSMKYGRGTQKEVITKFIKMYVNDLTVDMGEIGKKSIEKIFLMASTNGIFKVKTIDFI